MYLFWAFQNEIWNEVAMKLRFSRIAEQRKCSISFVTSGNLAGKREAVHFVPNPWDFWRKWNLGSDLRWIPHWTHLCGAFGRLPPTHPSTKICSEISRGLKVRWWPQQLEDVLPGELRQFIRAEDAHAMKAERGLGKRWRLKFWGKTGLFRIICKYEMMHQDCWKCNVCIEC